MAFTYTNKKGVAYYLHSRAVTLKNGLNTRIFYFARTEKAGAEKSVPVGYIPGETKSGLPILRKAVD